MRTRFTWFIAGACLLLALAPAFGSGGSEAPATKAQPVTTLKVTTYHAASDSMETFYETPVGKLIERETNVRVQIVGKPSDTYQALLADLASDSLPDISVFWAEDNVSEAFRKAATEGMLAPLSKAIAQHGPIIDYAMKRQLVAAEIKELYLRPEFKGETYIIPTHYSVQQPWLGAYGLYIRGDVADQLGIKTPDRTIRTTDDLYNLLMKIKSAGVKDINGKPAYPMGSFTWDGIVYDAMGRPYAFGGPSLIGADKGKVKSFIESDEWSWNYIKWMRKLVKDGLVDPEMFTDKYERMTEKIAQGRFAVWPMFATFAVTPATAYIQALLSAAPQMAYRPLGNMDTYLGNGDVVITDKMNRGLSLAVSKKTDAAAAVRLINWLTTKDGHASVRYGIKDQQWSWTDKGFAKLTPAAFEEVTKDAKGYLAKYGAGHGILNLMGEVAGLDDPKYDVTGTGSDDVLFYQNKPADLDAMNAARAAVYGQVQVARKDSLSSLLLTYPNKDQFQPVWDQMKSVIFQCILLDSEQDARKALDQYRETLKKNGYDDFIAYLQKQYDSNPGKYPDYVTQ